MSIFKDKIKRYFGFETSKEYLDRKINNYKLKAENETKHDMAISKQAISDISEQIRQLEIIIKDNQYFIDSYEIIMAKALEKVKQGNSLIYGKLFDKNGHELFQGNYKTMNDYYIMLLKRGIDATEIEYYNRQISEFLKKAWIYYANCIILLTEYKNKVIMIIIVASMLLVLCFGSVFASAYNNTYIPSKAR